MGQATDVSRVKGALRIPAGITVHDVRIGEIVAEVESDILQDLRLDSFAVATYTDRLDVDPGDAGRVFALRRLPVTSVVGLTVDGVGLTEGTDFYLGTGGILRLIPECAGTMPGRQGVVCTYVAGHVVAGATPSWLARWATLAAARQYNQEPMSGFAALDVEPTSRSVARAGFDEDACEREIGKLRARWIPR